MADPWSTKNTLTALLKAIPKETPFTIVDASQALQCGYRTALQRLTTLHKNDRIRHLGPGKFALIDDQEKLTPQYDEEDLEHKQWVLAILQTKKRREHLAQLHSLSRI